MNASMSKYEAEHVLGLTGSYTRADVRKAQGKLSKAFHPDVAERHGMTKEQAQERMLAVNNAFKVLMTLFADDPKRVVACDEPWALPGVTVVASTCDQTLRVRLLMRHSVDGKRPRRRRSPVLQFRPQRRRPCIPRHLFAMLHRPAMLLMLMQEGPHV